jgi:hypothetical protein
MVSRNFILPALVVPMKRTPRPASAETYTLHFTIARSLILINGTVNGLPAKLIFDTGAIHTILSLELLGLTPAQMEMQNPEFAYGTECDNPVWTHISLVLDKYELARVRVIPSDLSDVSNHLKVRCDGIFGQDLMGTFNSVRIDYRQKIIELEK